MPNPTQLPPDRLPPDGLPDDGLLRQALSEEAATALPTVSADPWADQARLEGLLAGGGLDEAQEGVALVADDLALLADLLVAQAQVAAGSAQAPSRVVLEAVCAAFDAALLAGSVEPVVDAAPARDAAAVAPGVGLRVLGAGQQDRVAPTAVRHLRQGSWLAAAAAVLVACVGTYILARAVSPRASRSAGPTNDASGVSETSASLDPTELASLNRTLEGTPGSDGGRAQVAPFVEARLWRRVAGRALRGGEGLGLAQDPHAQLGGPNPAAALSSDGVLLPDVVLSWLPDAASGAAARLRVHVSGPQGLVVMLPDLGVEAVLAGLAVSAVEVVPGPVGGSAASASGAASATYVDLELPGGWASRLPERELRLAFRWPAPAGNSLPNAHARFDGVSLASTQTVKGS